MPSMHPRHDYLLDAARRLPTFSLLYVCNPNNPTGTVIPGATLRDFWHQAARRTLVVVDEAELLELADDGATQSMVDLALRAPVKTSTCAAYLFEAAWTRPVCASATASRDPT